MSHIVGISENLGNCSRNLERLFSKLGNSIKKMFPETLQTHKKQSLSVSSPSVTEGIVSTVSV